MLTNEEKNEVLTKINWLRDVMRIVNILPYLSTHELKIVPACNKFIEKPVSFTKKYKAQLDIYAGLLHEILTDHIKDIMEDKEND